LHFASDFGTLLAQHTDIIN